MAYIWTPDAGVLLSYRDDGNGFSGSVSVIGDPANATVDPVTGMETPPPDPDTFEVSGLDDVLTFSSSGNTWTVSATGPEAAGLFPVEITYLLTPYKDSKAVVSTWQDLPEEAHEVVKLVTKASSPYVTSFDVTASVGGEDAETKTYSIEVIHTYTANADRLKLEVDKRR